MVILEELKGKLVNIKFNGMEELETVKLIDYDNNFIKIEHSSEIETIICLWAVTFIEHAEKNNIDKFYEYRKRFKEDPYFEGDSGKDKGYTVIRRGKNGKPPQGF